MSSDHGPGFPTTETPGSYRPMLKALIEIINFTKEVSSKAATSLFTETAVWMAIEVRIALLSTDFSRSYHEL